ncbi:MAG TPA: SRPBCC family protein [Gemmatimonadaceae bacterium]|nr:SRPBCC family protein [Gemmatimonadaceae bacterium]
MRYALIAVGVLVALVLCVVVIGYALPKHHHVTVQRAYAAKPEAMFALISDVRGYPSWRTGLRTVEVLADVGGHLRWKEITNSNGPISYVMEETVPNRKLVARIADTNLPFGGAWTYELTPVGGGTVVAITEDGDVFNPIFRFVSRFVMGHTATIQRFLDDVEKRFPAAIAPAD